MGLNCDKLANSSEELVLRKKKFTSFKKRNPYNVN